MNPTTLKVKTNTSHSKLANPVWRKGLFVLLTLTTLSGVAWGQRFISELADFERHIALHRQRVVILGLTLAKEHFPSLDLRRLEQYLSLHDLSKTSLAESTRASLGDLDNRKPSERLFEFYGKANLNESERQELRNLVSHINRIDFTVSSQFFSQDPKTNPEAQEFRQIEQIADLVDRSFDPIAAEEFGRPMKPASEFLEDPEMRRLSAWLEQRYPETTTHLQYTTVERCRRTLHHR